MNQTIIRNWNDMVDETDAVLFGGDLTHSGVDKQGFYEWVYTVNGIELILRGNHDPYNRSELADAALPIVETHEFSYGDTTFNVVTSIRPSLSELKSGVFTATTTTIGRF